jgi:molecular chaperone HscB
MSPDLDSFRPVETLECRHCGAGAPIDEHFCGQCSKILALGRHGNYFTFFGLPRKLGVDERDLERRFRELSRQFHPDYYYNAEPAERLASLERTSYLNDAYRTLRDPMARIEYLLSLEGLSPVSLSGAVSEKVPPALLEEVFALNEALDEIRELRETGNVQGALRARLQQARKPIEQKHQDHKRRLTELSATWDALADEAPERGAALDALHEVLLEHRYVQNLIAAIEREEQYG